MSIYRQLWLAIIVSMLLALSGSLFASLLSARAYLQEQLAMMNIDNAAVIALSLSQNDPDAVGVELAVAALFDSGHYESIRVVDPFGKPMVERVSPLVVPDAPAWFVRLLPIRVSPGQAQISSGWKQFGTVILASHSRFAYRALWKSTLNMMGALALAGLVCGYLGTLILRRLGGPLQAVVNQATAIAERRFVTIDEPSVPELKQLARAMNSAVTRLKAMFEEEATRLDTVRRETNFDALTGLANRSHFMARLRQTMDAEDSVGGALLLVRVADLFGINHRLGRAATDDLLRQVGMAVGDCADSRVDGLAARLNGADFAVLLPGQHRARDAAEALLRSLIQCAAPFVDHGYTAHIGVGGFGQGVDMSALLARVDAALASAEAGGSNAVSEAEAAGVEDMPKSAEQWAHLIRRALDQGWVRLISFPVADLSGRLVHRECPLRLMFDEQGEWQPAGRFLPVAERLRLTPALDLAAVTLGLDELEKHPQMAGLAINLSAASVENLDFRNRLLAMLSGRRQATARLWLEVAETGALKHLDALRILCHELKPLGCRLGLEHFGRQFSQIGLLHDIGLDYLKVDASFIRGIEGNTGNQAFLKGLSGIAHNIGMTVYAEGVASVRELATLSDLGFDGATGPAVKD